MILLGELPDLEETTAGKELIAIGAERGKKEGKKEGKTESILVFLEAKHGPLPKELRKAVAQLSSVKASRLLAHLPQCETLDDVQAWLDGNANRNGRARR